MRVLQLPVNVASQIGVTVRALRAVGAEARGLIADGNRFQNADGLEVAELVSRRHPWRWARARARWVKQVVEAIEWSDVVHWHFAQPALPGALDLRLARFRSKLAVVEFWGSEVRVPEEEEKLNPYYARRGPGYEYRQLESRAGSYARQRRFARAGVDVCLAPPTFSHYLEPGLWRRVLPSRPRVCLEDFQPCYPAADRRRPVLAHSPSARVGKGTDSVLRAVESLRQRHDFEFCLIENRTFAEANELKSGCDVYLDQFVTGGEYGLAAVEAMALGKPVVTYLRPDARAHLGRECPVVVATQDDLAQVLESLLVDAQLRHDLGRRSRRFAEEHHDALHFARGLVAAYRDLLDERAVRTR